MAVNELTLYQIGDIVFDIGEQQWHGYDTTMKSTDQRLLFSREFAFGGSPRTPEPRQFTVSGVLLDTSNTVQEFVGMYHSLEGVITDLIAYEPISCCTDPDCCGCSNDWEDILWWNTLAQIISIKLSEGEGNTINISITLKAQTTWTAINRFLWEWSDRKKSVRGLELPLATPASTVINTTGAAFSAGLDVGIDGFGTSFIQVAQSFTLPRSGFISRVSFYVRSTGFTLLSSVDHTWEIYTGSEATGPAGVPIAFGRFNIQETAMGTENVIIMPAPVPVIFGQTYFLVIRRTYYPNTNNDFTWIETTTPSVLSTGKSWRDVNGAGWAASPANSDWRFTVTMDYNFFGELSPYPTINDVLSSKCSSLWVRHNWTPETIIYYPDVWQIIHDRHRHGYPSTGVGTNWESELPVKTVTVNRKYFSVEPSSLYAFTGLVAGTGNILISVNRFNRNVWRNTRSDSSIDLALLNVDMAAAGYIGLATTDTLIVGDSKIKPGFVMRNGAILSNVTPRVVYQDGFPGELGPGFNEIRLTVPNGASYAQLHNFRRL